MQNQTVTAPETIQSAALSIAARYQLPQEQIIPFGDLVDAITQLCNVCTFEGSSFRSLGHLFPDLEIAVDRAGMQAIEILSESPFAADIDVAFKQEINSHDLLWVSNPNRITGSHYSVNELERLAKLVPNGYLIIDEPYPSCFGITASSLLESCQNIIIVHPFAESSSDAGFLITTNHQLLEQLQSDAKRLSTATAQRLMQEQVSSPDAEEERIELLYHESLRLALRLSRMNVRCWITATDFLLIRVGDPTGAGNHFASHDVRIENLSGYPQLNGYLRYRIQSPQANERFLGAMDSMPEQLRVTRPSDLLTISLKSDASIESLEYLNRVKHIFAEQEDAKSLERVSVYAAQEEH